VATTPGSNAVEISKNHG